MTYDEGDDDLEALVLREAPASVGGGCRQLKVYRQAHELGVAAHRLSLRLPKDEMYETSSQLRRAAKAVSANIVEGYGRRHYKAEYLRFLIYAKSSLDETEEHLQYVKDCHPGESDADNLLQLAHSLGRKPSRFLELVEARHLA